MHSVTRYACNELENLLQGRINTAVSR